MTSLSTASSAVNSGFLVNWCLIPFLRPILTNMRQMEEYLETKCQDINYTVVRPPGLGNAPQSDAPGWAWTEHNEPREQVYTEWGIKDVHITPVDSLELSSPPMSCVIYFYVFYAKRERPGVPGNQEILNLVFPFPSTSASLPSLHPCLVPLPAPLSRLDPPPHYSRCKGRRSAAAVGTQEHGTAHRCKH
ncbi:hypothetical protein E2C01_006175 [Portunus trituberculatus]|uniref:NAD(P)-binding domain-containing protein n=1 Tax=Portunus trituberculatus TaxID=210409 RepID=A0A5B7CVM8_PORTR|nr:hypothetical protein [Portunus trituberculatus]